VSLQIECLLYQVLKILDFDLGDDRGSLASRLTSEYSVSEILELPNIDLRLVYGPEHPCDICEALLVILGHPLDLLVDRLIGGAL
jgi:hypothetical protein